MDSDGPQIVSWREYVDIIVERETRVILTKLSGIEAARTMQALELARRLEELNHAHRQTLEDRSEFVRHSELQNLQRQFEEFRERTAAVLAQHRGRDSVVYSLIGFMVAAAVAVIHSAWGSK